MKISNRDFLNIAQYRKLIKDNIAVTSQRIAVEMYDQLRELEQRVDLEKAARENPVALTLEQLLELDGEPVWCDHHQWALVEVLDYTPYLRYSGGTKQRACELFAIDYRIYAHKPGREVRS